MPPGHEPDLLAWEDIVPGFQLVNVNVARQHKAMMVVRVKRLTGRERRQLLVNHVREPVRFSRVTPTQHTELIGGVRGSDRSRRTAISFTAGFIR